MSLKLGLQGGSETEWEDPNEFEDSSVWTRCCRSIVAQLKTCLHSLPLFILVGVMCVYATVVIRESAVIQDNEEASAYYGVKVTEMATSDELCDACGKGDDNTASAICFSSDGSWWIRRVFLVEGNGTRHLEEGCFHGLYILDNTTVTCDTESGIWSEVFLYENGQCTPDTAFAHRLEDLYRTELIWLGWALGVFCIAGFNVMENCCGIDGDYMKEHGRKFGFLSQLFWISWAALAAAALLITATLYKWFFPLWVLHVSSGLLVLLWLISIADIASSPSETD